MDAPGGSENLIDEWTWKKVVEDQDSDNNQTLGCHYGYWSGRVVRRESIVTSQSCAPMRDRLPPCFTDARHEARGSLVATAPDCTLGRVDDGGGRLSGGSLTSTKLTPSRFKTSIAVWEPKMANSRNLLPQPHFFTFFGVRDFLGGKTVNDIWVFTQVKNTNEKEARNRGSFTSPLAMRRAVPGRVEDGFYR